MFLFPGPASLRGTRHVPELTKMLDVAANITGVGVIAKTYNTFTVLSDMNYFEYFMKGNTLLD